jgi:DNA-binding NtrC family response regulator
MEQLATLQTALVVEHDHEMRHLMDWLFEESDYRVIDADSTDAAISYLERHGLEVTLCFADFKRFSDGGAQFAAILARRYPWIRLVISTSDVQQLRGNAPSNTAIIPRPWRPLDILIHAEMVKEAKSNATLAAH